MRASVCGGGARLSPRGSSGGLGSPTGHLEPASPGRSSQELSHWLLLPCRHRECLSDPRRGLHRSDDYPPPLTRPTPHPACSWVSARPSPFCTRLGNGSPRGMPREPGGESAVKPAQSRGPSGLELNSCGMCDTASPWQGWGGRSPSVPPA